MRSSTGRAWARELGLAVIAASLVALSFSLKPNPPGVALSSRSRSNETAQREAVTPELRGRALARGDIGDENPSGRGAGGEKGKQAAPAYRATGVFVTAGGTEPASGPGPVRTLAVQVEKGLPVEPATFAAKVSRVLGSDRSWSGRGGFGVRRIASPNASFRVLLASPQTTDEICAPLLTNGIFSCAEGTTAVLNYMRWMEGAAAYGDKLASYRTYMINHEVGHVFGHGHLMCPAPGGPAPVMVQQTKGVGSCKANPWPLPSEG